MADRRVAVITGASSGIGAETARALRREQPDDAIVLVARREDRLRDLAAEVGGTYLVLDVTEDDAPARMREHLEAEHGGALHLLVNNAGASWRSTFADGGYANVRRHMDLNFDAVVRLTEALLPLLRASAPSAIVNVGSVAGRVARGGAGAYSASKFALIGWSEALHQEEKRARRPRGRREPRLHEDRGLPRRRADRAAGHAVDRLDAREVGRRDPRRRPAREGRALRPAAVGRSSPRCACCSAASCGARAAARSARRRSRRPAPAS